MLEMMSVYFSLWPDNMQALDLIVTAKGPFAVANTSQSLPRMPVIYGGGPFDDPDVLPSIVCSVLSCMLYLQLRHASNKSRPGGAYLLTCQQRFLLGHLAASASQWFTKFLTRKNPVVGHWEVTQEQNACC